eukprot:GFUD01128269.1.p1 GENE.GFUD01128269.1~~GFUD01128269.1.p1  ORF type:complete len:181 (-),score=36.19 GFUD01128269.1:201-743(-)
MFGPVQICLVLLSISFVQVTCKPQQDVGSMLGGILKDPNIQGVLNNLDGQDLSGLLNNVNLDNLADNPDLGGIIGGLLNNANTPGTSENEETGNAGADQSLGGINLFEILKNINITLILITLTLVLTRMLSSQLLTLLKTPAQKILVSYPKLLRRTQMHCKAYLALIPMLILRLSRQSLE